MSDLTLATRELFHRSLVDTVKMRTPVVEELERRNQITHSGGKYIERLVSYDNIDDLMQVYDPNDALTDQKKNLLDKPRFTFRLAQLPLRYDAEEQLMNHSAGQEIQLLDLAKLLVDKGQEATKLWLSAQIFNSASATGVADGTTSSFQSLVSALDHDVTYGTLTRTLGGPGTRDWWQGCDPAGLIAEQSSSTQGTATNLTISNLRKWIYETDISHYMDGADNLKVYCCPTLYNKLRAEMESKLIYKPGLKQSQGITSMMLDGGIEIQSVPYLQASSTTRTWLFILNMKHLELRIHTERNFKMTDFKWQGDVANGHDYWLARVLISGNLVCWKPNSSMWLSNVS
jgi:hypothetical protein